MLALGPVLVGNPDRGCSSCPAFQPEPRHGDMAIRDDQAILS